MAQHDCPGCEQMVAELGHKTTAEVKCPCCREFEMLVSEFVDGQVDEFRVPANCEKSQEQLCAHLAVCPQCQELASAEQAIRQLLVRCYQTRAPQELRVRIHESLTMVRATLPPA